MGSNHYEIINLCDHTHFTSTDSVRRGSVVLRAIWFRGEYEGRDRSQKNPAVGECCSAQQPNLLPLPQLVLVQLQLYPQGSSQNSGTLSEFSPQRGSPSPSPIKLPLRWHLKHLSFIFSFPFFLRPKLHLYIFFVSYMIKECTRKNFNSSPPH